LEVPVSELFDQPQNDVINCPHCGGKIKISKHGLHG
jgi:DNA-directed RNA polymerase subunit RPC12/RpoP